MWTLSFSNITIPRKPTLISPQGITREVGRARHIGSARDAEMGSAATDSQISVNCVPTASGAQQRAQAVVLPICEVEPVTSSGQGAP